jgi:hypothetical protein
MVFLLVDDPASMPGAINLLLDLDHPDCTWRRR